MRQNRKNQSRTLGTKCGTGKWLRKFEFLGNRLGGFLVGFLEIAHQALSLRDHFEKSSTRMKVFLILLEMIGELLNSLSKHRNLILRRPRILFMPLHFFCRLRFLLRRQHSFSYGIGLVPHFSRANPSSSPTN